MKYTIIVGSYKHWTDPLNIEIPDEIFFFCNKGEIGPGGLHDNSEHYHTIVRTKDYKSWLKKIDKIYGVYLEELGEYTIVSIYSLRNDTPIPTIDRKEWIKRNNIDFNKYVIVNKDIHLNVVNAYRIIDFISPWNIEHICVTFRDFFSRGEYYSLNIDSHELDTLISSEYDERIKSKIIEGDEAEVFWNSMIYQVVSKTNYNPTLADKEYDFNKERKEYIKLFKEKGLNDFVKILEESES